MSITVRPSFVALTRRRNGSMYDTFSGMGAVNRPAGVALSGPRPVVRLTARSARPSAPWRPAGSGRTMASTENEATSAPSRSYTRFSACVVPAPANVERWW